MNSTLLLEQISQTYVSEGSAVIMHPDEVVSELQMRIMALENELKKHKDAGEKSGKVDGLTFEHNFYSESLF